MYPKLNDMNTTNVITEEMVKNRFNEIVIDEISERVTQMIEDLSTNEFLEKIMDTYYDVYGKVEVDDEVVTNIIGQKVFPLFQKISEYNVENLLK